MLRKVRFEIIDRLLKRINILQESEYLSFLRYFGIFIGEATYISPGAIIDSTRHSLVSIGNQCYVNSGFKMLTHDFVAGVIRHVYGEFINSSGRVTIGNNVFIAANSLVTKDVPGNSIVAGSPAKVICTLDEYRQKRLMCNEEEALDYARSIWERFHRNPKVDEFYEEFSLFVDHENEKEYTQLPILQQLGGKVEYSFWKKNNKRKYRNFNQFLESSFKSYES